MIFASSPTEFDRDVLALDIAGLIQTLVKGSQHGHVALGRSALMYPTTGIAGCCARAASGHAAAAPSAATNSRRLIIGSSRWATLDAPEG